MKLEKTKEEVLSELKVTLFPQVDSVSCWVYRQYIAGQSNGKLIFDLSQNGFGFRPTPKQIKEAQILCQKFDGRPVYLVSGRKKEPPQQERQYRKIPNYPSYGNFKSQRRMG